MSPTYAFRRLLDGSLTLCDPLTGAVLVPCKGLDATDAERNRAHYAMEIKRRQVSLLDRGAT